MVLRQGLLLVGAGLALGTVAAFAEEFPKVKFVKSKRFVQSDSVILTAGGITSGIDGALHVVERYFGRAIAQQTADYMEYEGTGWKQN